MRKLGVFLGFQPGANLSTEGIGRLLAFILKEQNEKDFGIVLFCPGWLTDSVNKLLKDNKVAQNKCQVISTKKIPIGVKLKNYLLSRRKETTKISRLKLITRRLRKQLYNKVNKLIAEYISTSSWITLFLKSLMYLVITILVSPIITTIAICYFLFMSVRLITSKIFIRICKISFINKILSNLKKVAVRSQGKLYQAVLDNELDRIVKLINKRVDVKTCFIPSMAWPQVSGINCKKVLAAPDILFYDFPTQYSDTIVAHNRIRKSIDSADHLICYSDYVKINHLIDKCGVNEDKISVIKHANIDMKEHLKVSQSLSSYFTEIQNAKLLINEYIKNKFGNGSIFYDSNISEFDYVIYSSQSRPHKNIYNLVKAIKIINKDMYKDIKIILTGDITQEDFMQSYINENHLGNDVFVMHSLSSEVLAAFNKLAVCAVNPTLFEGGFPFTFSEAYSVGTPSVMSNIPVVTSEIHDGELREIMLFDPYNPYSIAQKIIWAVENRQELLEAQAQLYQQFNQRDWKKVVGEYNAVFRKYMN